MVTKGDFSKSVDKHTKNSISEDKHDTFLESMPLELSDWWHIDYEQTKSRFLDWMLQAADPTEVTWQTFCQELSWPVEWLAGESVTSGHYQCLSCHNMFYLAEFTALNPCTKCQGVHFQRMDN